MSVDNYLRFILLFNYNYRIIVFDFTLFPKISDYFSNIYYNTICFFIKF